MSLKYQVKKIIINKLIKQENFEVYNITKVLLNMYN